MVGPRDLPSRLSPFLPDPPDPAHREDRLSWHRPEGGRKGHEATPTASRGPCEVCSEDRLRALEASPWGLAAPHPCRHSPAICFMNVMQTPSAPRTPLFTSSRTSHTSCGRQGEAGGEKGL